MATASEDRCPICLDTWDNAACTIPCLHRFCFICIWQWAETKIQCPLCRRRMTAIRHLLREDEFEELPLRPAMPTALDAEFLGAIPSSTWRLLFRQHPDLLRPLRPWLRQELGSIFGEESSQQVLILQDFILAVLPLLDLDEEQLVPVLSDDLGSHTTVFVQGLIEFTVERCGRAAYHHLLRDTSRAARGLEERRESNLGVRTRSPGFQEGRGRDRSRSPMASTSSAAAPGGSPAPSPAPSSSAAAADAEELPGTSTAALGGGLDCPPSVPTPIPGEHQEPHQEPGEAAAGPRPGGGCSRRPPKRKAGGSQDSAPPTEKPPRQ